MGLEQIYTTELRVPGVTNQPSAAQSNIALEMTAQPEMELDTIDGRTGGRELQRRGVEDVLPKKIKKKRV